LGLGWLKILCFGSLEIASVPWERMGGCNVFEAKYCLLVLKLTVKFRIVTLKKFSTTKCKRQQFSTRCDLQVPKGSKISTRYIPKSANKCIFWSSKNGQHVLG
jgi:hypothetical protein